MKLLILSLFVIFSATIVSSKTEIRVKPTKYEEENRWTSTKLIRADSGKNLSKWEAFLRQYASVISGYVQKEDWRGFATWMATKSRKSGTDGFAWAMCANNKGDEGFTKLWSQWNQSGGGKKVDWDKWLSENNKSGGNEWWTLLSRAAGAGNKAQRAERKQKMTIFLNLHKNEMQNYVKAQNWDGLVKFLNDRSSETGLAGFDWSRIYGKSQDKDAKGSNGVTFWRKVANKWATTEGGAPVDWKLWLKENKKELKGGDSSWFLNVIDKRNGTHSNRRPEDEVTFNLKPETPEAQEARRQQWTLFVKNNGNQLRKLVADKDWKGFQEFVRINFKQGRDSDAGQRAAQWVKLSLSDQNKKDNFKNMWGQWAKSGKDFDVAKWSKSMLKDYHTSKPGGVTFVPSKADKQNEWTLFFSNNGNAKTDDRKNQFKLMISLHGNEMRKYVQNNDWKGLVTFMNKASKDSGSSFDWSKVFGSNGSADQKTVVWRQVVSRWAEKTKDQNKDFDWRAEFAAAVAKQRAPQGSVVIALTPKPYTTLAPMVGLNGHNRRSEWTRFLETNGDRMKTYIKSNNWQGLTLFMRQNWKGGANKGGDWLSWVTFTPENEHTENKKKMWTKWADGGKLDASVWFNKIVNKGPSTVRPKTTRPSHVFRPRVTTPANVVIRPSVVGPKTTTPANVVIRPSVVGPKTTTPANVVIRPSHVFRPSVTTPANVVIRPDIVVTTSTEGSLVKIDVDPMTPAPARVDVGLSGVQGLLDGNNAKQEWTLFFKQNGDEIKNYIQGNDWTGLINFMNTQNDEGQGGQNVDWKAFFGQNGDNSGQRNVWTQWASNGGDNGGDVQLWLHRLLGQKGTNTQVNDGNGQFTFKFDGTPTDEGQQQGGNWFSWINENRRMSDDDKKERNQQWKVFIQSNGDEMRRDILNNDWTAFGKLLQQNEANSGSNRGIDWVNLFSNANGGSQLGRNMWVKWAQSGDQGERNTFDFGKWLKMLFNSIRGGAGGQGNWFQKIFRPSGKDAAEIQVIGGTDGGSGSDLSQGTDGQFHVVSWSSDSAGNPTFKISGDPDLLRQDININ